MNNVPVLKVGSLANVIRKFRVSEKLSQEDLACLAGVLREDVAKIEHQEPLQLEIKLKILRVLYAKRLAHRSDKDSRCF